MKITSLPHVLSDFTVPHQLTVLQRVDELSVLTGQDGARQVQHHADCRQQHEEGDLWCDRKIEREKKNKTKGQTVSSTTFQGTNKQNRMWSNVSLVLHLFLFLLHHGSKHCAFWIFCSRVSVHSAKWSENPSHFIIYH